MRYGDSVQAQEVQSQSSYLSVNDSRLHFGLGQSTAADVEIRWPLGQVEKFPGVPADQLVYCKEGSGITSTPEIRDERMRRLPAPAHVRRSFRAANSAGFRLGPAG